MCSAVIQKHHAGSDVAADVLHCELMMIWFGKGVAGCRVWCRVHHKSIIAMTSGAALKFELAVGLNGRVWVSSPDTVRC